MRKSFYAAYAWSEWIYYQAFDPSLFVTIRKRIGVDDFNDMSESLLKLQVELQENKEKEEREKKENGNNDDNHHNMELHQKEQIQV